MEKILKSIPQKLEPTGLFLTEAERKYIAEALHKVGFQHRSQIADLLEALMINGEYEIYIDTGIAQEIIEAVRSTERGCLND